MGCLAPASAPRHCTTYRRSWHVRRERAHSRAMALERDRGVLCGKRRERREPRNETKKRVVGQASTNCFGEAKACRETRSTFARRNGRGSSRGTLENLRQVRSHEAGARTGTPASATRDRSRPTANGGARRGTRKHGQRRARGAARDRPLHRGAPAPRSQRTPAYSSEPSVDPRAGAAGGRPPGRGSRGV